MVVKKQKQFSWIGNTNKASPATGWLGVPRSNMILRNPSLKNPPMNPLRISPPGDRNLTWAQAKKKYPRMNPYGDDDNDLFLNVDDCHPLDPTRDGILAAIAGAVGGVFGKGGTAKERISMGWKAGMAKTGWHAPIQTYKARRAQAREASPERFQGAMIAKRLKEEASEVQSFRNSFPALAKNQSNEEIKSYIKKVEQSKAMTPRMIPNQSLDLARSQARRERLGKTLDIPGVGKVSEKQYWAMMKQQVEQQTAIAKGQKQIQTAQENEKAFGGIKRFGKYLYKAVPGLSETVSPTRQVKQLVRVNTAFRVEKVYGQDAKTGKRIVLGTQEVPIKWKMVQKVVDVPISYGTKIESMRRRIQEGKITPVMARKIASLKKGVRMTFQGIPAGSVSGTFEYQSKSGTRAGRGRPPRSYDPRYAQYGGVMGYRRALSEQRRRNRQVVKMQEQMMKAQRQPQYERQQYTQAYPTEQQQQIQQQLPQELQGQGITPEYSQFQQESPPPIEYAQPQQVYQQPQPQYVQEPQQRPIATVFKSSGGSPYPPVPRASLAPTRETIPQGYVESVDAFTGRRFLKPLPKRETWAQ